jgi:hypothetical protein
VVEEISEVVEMVVEHITEFLAVVM